MKAKKWLALILAGCMGICCLSGCGNSTGNGDKTSANADTAVQGRESSDAEKVKLTALISKHSLTKDVNEMEWLNLLEEENGVDVEWQQITADWDQKKKCYVCRRRYSGYFGQSNSNNRFCNL